MNRQHPSNPLTVRIDPQHREFLTKAAQQLGTSQKDLVNMAVEQFRAKYDDSYRGEQQ